jgi:hypothetical protein
MKKLFLSLLATLCITSCNKHRQTEFISIPAIQKTISELKDKAVDGNITLLEKGVRQTAKLWQRQDGSEADFIRFCIENYISDPKEKEQIFLKTSEYLEVISGNFNNMTLGLTRNVQLTTGPMLAIDEQFAAYSPNTHLSDDMYANKLAFLITLNFPEYSLDEKQTLGEDRLAWAYARLGDMFTSRVPAEIQQAAAKALSDADIYVSSYNIHAGNLLNRSGEKIFDKDLVLLSHWNLRDEIKANYNSSNSGLDRQQTIYEAMKRIISQDIPTQAINSGQYDWNPYTNELFKNGIKADATPESTTRYQVLLNNFKASKAVDRYTGNTAIDRNFSVNMEVEVEDAEQLFRNFLSSPGLKKAGTLVASRLGRPLQAFDIWYNGFKPRSTLNEDKLSEHTRSLYPTAEAFKQDIPNILQKLGFSSDRAKYISDRIDVDAARGSGHAWAATMKGQHSRLRTRIPAGGMDYKGYNIAIHELGHNVEQTISLYDIDYYTMSGVPNTAFTEALAFIFQQRDLDILGIKNANPGQEQMQSLDKLWNMYEITGVSLLDILTWKWMYSNPEATAGQLKQNIIRLAKEIWNEYYAPVFGVADEPVLAIYSHTLSYPLYLSAYAYGQIIEFQLEKHLSGRNFAEEVERIFRLGRLTPGQWILQATGRPLTVEPMFDVLETL